MHSLFVRSCNLLWLRGLLRLVVAQNLGLSPPAVCASAAVRFIFGHSSRGQIAVPGGGVGGCAEVSEEGASAPTARRSKSVRSGAAATRNR